MAVIARAKESEGDCEGARECKGSKARGMQGECEGKERGRESKGRKARKGVCDSKV
jgi:hypothetical protein